MKRWGGSLAWMAAVHFGAIADAQPVASRISLAWRAPPTARCPSATRVGDALAEASGLTIADDAGGPVVAMEVVAGRTLRLTLTIREPSGAPLGQRIFEGPSCDALVRRGVVAAALALDPRRSGSPAPPAPTAPTPAPRPPVIVRVDLEALPRPPPTAPPAPARIALELGVRAGLSLGVTPELGPVATLRAHLGFGALGVELQGRAVPALDVSRATAANLWAGAVLVCARLGAFLPCGGAVVGAFEGVGDGARREIPLNPYVGAALSGFGRLRPHRRVVLELGAELGLTVLGVDQTRGGITVWEMPRVTASVLAGVAWLSP